MADIAVYRDDSASCVVLKDGKKVFTFTPDQWSVICIAANADMENRLYALIHGETLRLERERKWQRNREKLTKQSR